MSSRTRGFTILEVMVAIVILAVGLASLFASEAGAVKVAQRARTTTVATLLARCKMGEIEEKLAKDGFSTNSIDERDACCDGAEHDGFRCEWKVERIVLPELDSTPLDAAKKATDKLKAQTQGKDDNDKKDGKDAPPDGKDKPKDEKEGAKTEDPGASLMGGAGGDMLSSLLLEMSFPVMKPIIEENVRRVTVTVQWKEGSKEHSFDVVQFIVNEALGLIPDDEDGTNAAALAGQTGVGTGTTNTTGTSNTTTSSTTSTTSTGTR
jgi:general secretion pathway protein I